MNTILQQLYNGEICLIEQYRPILEEYKAIRKKHMDNYKGFIEKLGSPLDKEFIKIISERSIFYEQHQYRKLSTTKQPKILSTKLVHLSMYVFLSPCRDRPYVDL